jgi:hypothetical protein
MVSKTSMEGNETIQHLAKKCGHESGAGFFHIADADVSVNVRTFHR